MTCKECKQSKLSRRGFVGSVLAAGGGLAVFGGAGALAKLARADAGDGWARYYVFCYFGGGWDILLGLDPRDPAVFTDERVMETRIEPGYALMPAGFQDVVRDPTTGMAFGPYIGDLARHAPKLAVVRGMSMETLTHEVGRRRFLTGKPPAGLVARGSSASTWLASTLGAEDPVPNLSIGVESYNRGLPNYATALRADSVPNLVRALRFDDPLLDDMVDRAIDLTLTNASECDSARHSPFFQTAQGSRQKARQMVAANLASRFDFLAATTEMEAVRAHYGIDATLGPAALSTPEARGAMAATALKAGVSRCVTIAVATGLDTHFDEWETDQGPEQMRGFNVVARLIEDLEATPYGATSETWLDHTVIVGFSEFSRTALINARGGRDHALTNACFLAGGKIQGGTLIGASSDIALAPQAIDVTTGTLSPDGTVVRPEHILQTLFEDAGVGNDPDLRAPSISALLRA